MTVDFVSLAGIVAILAAPGPTNALLATSGATGGLRSVLAHVGAVVVGYLIAVSVLRAVGAPILTALPLMVPVLKLAIAGYLGYLGCCLWRHHAQAARVGAISTRRLFVATLFNPKAAIFAFALFPESAVGADPVAWFLGFAGAVALCSTGWLLLGWRIATSGGDLAARWVPRLASLVLGGFAVMLAGTTIAALV